MKYLSLQQAMLGMRVVLTDTGMLIKSPAGSAEYDLKGRRTKVNGCPEYFPGQLRVKDKRAYKSGKVMIDNHLMQFFDGSGKLRVKIGCPEAPAAKLMGESFLNDAFIDPGSIRSAKINDPIDSNYQVKVETDSYGKMYAAGMGITGGDSIFKAKLSDDMRAAVIEAVRESKQFVELEAKNAADNKAGRFAVLSDAAKSLIENAQATDAQIARQAAVSVNLQTAIANMDEAIREAIRKEMQTGGAIWAGIKSR